MQPKIILIISHGEYDKKTGKFYLPFENNGAMEVLNQDNIKDMFATTEMKNT